ncbi:MAG: class I SAM-dependent methyltransferase [Motiliproteus sp.]|nr:class I SAM-dependent methyltransferase [Motiliproteus sp.]MCW9051585.1 class I SAM-dependent methyltransferase [Motiliproteus sp.]
MNDRIQQLDQHYSGGLHVAELIQTIEQQLPGLQPAEAFAAIDQLHLGGRGATLQLLKQVNPSQDDRYLDIGCGLGGSARLIAEQYSTEVVGIDLTAAYCQLAEFINKKLQHPLTVSILQGDITELPFTDNHFSGVLSQHCLMNLPNVDKVLSELHRTLEIEGKLLLHEIVTTDAAYTAGIAAPIRYPVPWASDPGHSFLQTESDLKKKLLANGFQIHVWEDETKKAVQWRQRTGTGQPRSLLSPTMVLGSDFKTMSENLFFNLQQGSVKVIAAIAVKI